MASHKLAAIAAAFLPCLVLAVPAPRAAATADASAVVRELYDTLLATMREGAQLGPRGRYNKMQPAVHRSFDMPFMTRIAFGPSFMQLEATQQQEISRAFERYITAVYVERFDGYWGEQFKVIGTRPSQAGILITSQIIKSTGEPVDINYLVHPSGECCWRIADIYLDGTISELAIRRSEFASILKAQGVEGLIETLNVRATQLGAR